MKSKKFLKAIENRKLLEAIRRAEEGTTSDIVVLISQKKAFDALDAANSAFKKLALEKALHQNSLLIFVAPASQNYAIVGGSALHSKVGQAWWDELAAILGTHFRKSHFGEGLVAAVEKAGQALQKHFPAGNIPDRSGQQDILEE